MEARTLLTIPPDITLYVLSFLPIPDLRSFSLIARQAHRCVVTHEDSIYHRAAILHKFTESQTSLEQAVQDEQIRSGWLVGVRGWKDFCRRWYVLEHNWNGHGEVCEGGYEGSASESITSFRIDDVQRTIITTSHDKGLVVHAMEDYRPLWGLSEDYVPRTRCEFSNGFLVFESKQHGLEIWRRSADVSHYQPNHASDHHITTPVPLGSPSAILASQSEAHEAASEAYQTAGHDDTSAIARLRGHFVPHAYIGKPHVHLPRISRICYPFLAIMSMSDPFSVCILDITSGELLDKVKMGGGPMVGSSPAFTLPLLSERVLMSLDITSTHLVLCLHAAIIVIRWHDRREDIVEGEEDERQMLVLGELDPPQVLLDNALRIFGTPDSPGDTGAIPVSYDCESHGALRIPGREAMKVLEILPPPASVLRRNHTALIRVGATIPPPCFVTVRFSPDGRHIAAVTAHGLFYLITDFHRVEHGQYFSQITQRIYMGDWLREIVWEHPRRLLIQTASEQYYLVNLDPSYHATSSCYKAPSKVPGFSRTSLPNLTIWHLRDISPSSAWRREQNSPLSGTQMTRTAIWTLFDFKMLYSDKGISIGSETTSASRRTDGAICYLSFTPGVHD
ncbi:hypothetical protein CERSUDRAFT_126831 [Gelatoporia subvermispora B]|uniref:F-box domain-containing protein n=1 Tax=Ceriporiopsis subvermispora (strain B) TaxID=914234 RepID=M2Q6K5_CERS8|nr:hypothetical protein CERSUDRAFT_126831 [Gelatoporia subvermispora B]